ncbi:MAG: four helix bundle protein [bacterium]
MEKQFHQDFNENFRNRSRKLALDVLVFYSELKGREELRLIGKQLIRSVTSVAANFRAACRARSNAEYFAKMCIVVEECDETLFWPEQRNP